MLSAIKETARAIASARHLVILTGAGASKESGIATFRDAYTGLWTQYRPEDLASPEGWDANPLRVWSWYWERRTRTLAAKPNPGHIALAELQKLVPSSTVITQNVDDLHERAGSPPDRVIHLHRDLIRWRCTENCTGDPDGTIVTDLGRPWNPEKDQYVPKCPRCNKFELRPNVVWFGESLPEDALTRATEACQKCDVMLVVGTSGVVYPAAGLPFLARGESGEPTHITEVNTEETSTTAIADVFLQAPAGEVLPQVLSALKTVKSEQVRSE